MEKIEVSKKNVLDISEDFDMGFLMELFNEGIKKRKSFKLVSEKFVIATEDFKNISGFKKEINKGKFKIYIM